MPFALPLISIAIEPIIIGALGTLTAIILGWYLSTPRGRLTWANIVRWADVQLKRPVEWALNNIKVGLKNAANAWDDFRYALKSYVQSVDNTFAHTRSWVISYIHQWIWPAVRALERWRVDAAAWLHKVVEARIRTLENWRVDATAWLHKVIEARIKTLENWRTAFIDWLRSVLLVQMLDLMIWRNNLEDRLNKTFTQVWKTISSIRQGVINLGASIAYAIASGVLPNVRDLINDLSARIAKVIGIPAIMAALGAWLASLVDNIAKEFEPDVRDLENLDIDWLLMAYLFITKPVLIDKSNEVINILFKCYKQVTSLGK